MRQIMNEKLTISESNPIRARYYDYDSFFYPWHFHSQYEIMYVKESFGQCFIGDAIEPYKAGDIIIFGSNLPHYMHSDESYNNKTANDRVKGTIIQFEENFMKYSFGSYPQLLGIKTMLEEAKRGIIFPQQQGSTIETLLNQFPSYEGIKQITKLLELLQEMATYPTQRCLASPHYYEKFPILGNKRIDKVLSYINSHYTQNVKLSNIAEIATMNTSAFCRYFKESTGKTYLQYVMEMRIGYACKLLSIKDLNIVQIAVECGFESISHFNKVFKQVTQFTPTEYKFNIRQKNYMNPI